VLQEPSVASEGLRPTWPQALFAGQDNIEKRLIELIGKENKSIKGAIYAFNNETISQAILDQMNKKNIKVSILVDKNYFNSKKEKKKNKSCLDRLGDSVHIVRGWHDADKTMHHKFLLFEDNSGESLLWNGSYNLTGAAQWNNENVIITNDRGLIKSFSNEFDRLIEQKKATTETQISS
jgi:phosphatidylserine/phosphatidylglycerophosphate/cardiolipin synthase-like enzyme